MSRPRGTLLAHTPERVDAILAAWRGGASYGEMAKRFDLEKNVVAGIVYRNRAPGEESARAFRPPRWSPGPKPKRLEHLSGGHMPTGRSVVHTAKMVPGGTFSGCQWIVGEKGVDFKLYAQAPRCPARVKPGSPYCPAHHKRCHVKQQSVDVAP